MAWKEVTNTATDIKKTPGQDYVGEYLSSKLIKTKIGEQTIYKFRDEEGNPFSIYGFTNLNRAMENIAEGTMCKITYVGTKNVQTKFGMKDVHQVRVEIDTAEVEHDHATEITDMDTQEPF